MEHPIYFEPKNSTKLFGLQENFEFLSELYLKKKLPNVLMFTGQKGIGKSTLINHFLFSIFDPSNYNKNKNILSETSVFFKQFKNNTFSNIIYINGSDFKSVKVDEIRNLKAKIFQSTISNNDRFIILDDIELFNMNSLNSLLKIIEEPTKNNFFFLINNKYKPILQTIKSRALDIKIILKNNTRLSIIKDLVNSFNLNLKLDPDSTFLTPGDFVKFNHICNEHDIILTNDYLENLSLLLNLYKKNKDILFINLALFIADYYFGNLKKNKVLDNNKIYKIKNYIFDNINSFMVYNLNQSTLLKAISEKLYNE